MASAVVAMSDEALVAHVLSTNGNAVLLFGEETLGEESVLKRAYKTMALRLHPDKNTHTGAREAFQVMQQTFEVAFEALRSRVPAPAPPVSWATHSPDPSGGKRRDAWAPPPPPPPSWPSKATDTTLGGKSHEDGSRAPRTKSHSEENVFVDHGLFEVPLPPDVFGEFTASSESEWCGARGADALCDAFPPAPPSTPPKETKTLPGLDPSSSDSSGDDLGKRNPRSYRLFCGTKQVKRKSLRMEKKGLQQQQEQQPRRKQDVGHRTLKQLFAKFNISDDEDEISPLHRPVSRGAGNRSGETYSVPQQHQGRFNTPQNFTSEKSSSRALVNVFCPLCGTGGFSAQAMSAVMCPSCRVRFVPTSVSMMTSECHTVSGGKGGNTSYGQMCACGRAKKGLCFLCD